MNLYIDVGNTKTKWCLSSNEVVEKTGSIFNTELNDLTIKTERIENVLISSVNSETLEQQIIEKIKPLCPHISFATVNKQFLNTKYFWGGKSCHGIDCSALLQIYFKFNNKFFPRDTKDQVKYCKRINKKEFKKGNIIYWKGHVGICIDNKNFIHAYGPRKKVLIMPTIKTINLIEKTAKLKIRKISNISQY